METKPLIVVRTWESVAVPPVCSIYWTAADWTRVTRRHCEPLILDACGYRWHAMNARNERGQLLYELEATCPAK